MRDSQDRRQELKADMVARLERVRGQMSDADFAQLISSVERTAARFAEIDAGPFMSARSSAIRPESDELPPGISEGRRPLFRR